MKIIDYDKKAYAFREVIASYMNIDEEPACNNVLENLHSTLNVDYSVFDVDTDQSTIFHKLFYTLANREDSDFYHVYKEFIRNEVTKEMGSDIIYQKYPTFRTHLPNNLGVGAFHKDRDYNHSESEVNFWLPVTDTWGTNTIWCESEEDLGDYEPIEVKHGQVLIFNGATLSHGNKINDTGTTRVSFDFRVVKKSEFKPSGKETVSQGKKFEIGDYFEELE
jgi:ectoine hydroxylase-related dioxygenase (phytanoyl-CoA dioxygenase family)